MTLTEFLLARIAEDEVVAKAATGTTARWRHGARSFDWETGKNEWSDLPYDSVVEDTLSDEGEWVVSHENVPTFNQAEHIALWDPARVLAECEAKRRVVLIEPISQGSAMMHAHILGILALPYADHPDYQEEWRL